MIKVGIAGADSPQAGELIRILVNHPDVDLLQASAPRCAGRTLSSVHHGLIGETSLSFSSVIDPVGLDALFMAPGSNPGEVPDESVCPDLRVIDFSGSPATAPGMTIALSEIFRKPLVRGAKRAHVLHPLASASLVALYPLAANLLVNDSLLIDVIAPESILTGADISTSTCQIDNVLRQVQSSFCSDIVFNPSFSGRKRSLKLTFTIPCMLPLDEIDRIYESIYDDHNFAFITHSPTGTREVSGTQKCVITIEKPDTESLRVSAVADCRLRGGAGDAMHAFNLLFGLHERTGLALKASKF